MRRILLILTALTISVSAAYAQPSPVNPYQVIIGTGPGEVAAGNDTRLVNALQKNRNLTDLTNIPAARTALGLGGLAILSPGANLTVNPNSTLSLTRDNVIAALGAVPLTTDALAPSATIDTTNAVNVTKGIMSPLRLPIATATTQGIVVPGNGMTVNPLGVLFVTYGTTANTAAQGNDSRITGALQASDAVTTYAPLASPAFTGTPTAPTPAQSDVSNKIATTAYVNTLLTVTGPSGILTISTTGGARTLTPTEALAKTIVVTGTLSSDATIIVPTQGQWVVANHTTGLNNVRVQTSGGIAIAVSQGASAILFGDGQGVQRAQSDYNGAFFLNNVITTATIQNSTLDGTKIGNTTPSTAVVTTLTANSTVGGPGFVTLLSPYALLNSPTFTGIPKAPAPASTDNSTQIATTAFVISKVTGATSGVASIVGKTGTVVLSDLVSGGVAPLASPAFTGAPTAPTAFATTNDTTIATTAFVKDAVNSGIDAAIPAASNLIVGTSTEPGHTLVIAPGAGLTLSGGLLSANGFGNSVPLIASATTGFFNPNYTTATPTGTPASVPVACAINITVGSESLNCYFNSVWHHISFAASAQ